MEKLCMDCKYFRQHYVRYKHGYQKIALSHCVFACSKQKQSGDKACEHFAKIEKNI